MKLEREQWGKGRGLKRTMSVLLVKQFFNTEIAYLRNTGVFLH